jgi:hypothetical protein
LHATGRQQPFSWTAPMSDFILLTDLHRLPLSERGAEHDFPSKY